MPFGYSSYVCDTKLSYKTPVIVSILDWRLGCMKYTFMLLIFLYVIIYNVLYNCNYLIQENPTGTLRFQLQQPTVKSANGAPCDPTKNTCHDDFTPLTQLTYCKQNPLHTSNHSCVYWDANQDVYMTQSSVLMTTRVAEYNQTKQCGSAATTCTKLWTNDVPNVKGVTSLIADMERYTLLLDHTVIAPTINVSASGRQCTGYLKVTRDALGWKDICSQANAVQPQDMDYEIDGGVPASCYISPNTTIDSYTKKATGLDVFDVSTMLAVSGIDLGGISPTNGRSIRYNGAVMVVNIRYQNWQKWTGTNFHYVEGDDKKPCEIPYEYELSSVLDTASKRQEIVYREYPDTRVLLNEHGIRLFVLQTGSLAKFSIAQLLIAVTSSLTLLAVATTLVDTLAIYVLPEKNYYSGFKYPETPHVSELVQEERKRSSLDSAAIAAVQGTSIVSVCFFVVFLFVLGGA